MPVTSTPASTFGVNLNTANETSKNNGAKKIPFADMLENSIQAMQDTQAVAQDDAYRLALGEADDLHTIAVHSAQASVALEMTVQVVSRAVNAYKEIMQMLI
jgi:flagellar hook-basal body complex protein FliE